MAVAMASTFQITAKNPSLTRVRRYDVVDANKSDRSHLGTVMKSFCGTKRTGREEEMIDGGIRKMRRINEEFGCYNNSKVDNHEPTLKNFVSIGNSRVNNEESSVGVKSSVQVEKLSSATTLEKLKTQGDSSSRSPARETKIDPRVEMLKKRFSGIISKAQNNTLFCPDHSEVKKLKTEVGMKAFEDPKLQRERERQAARLALEKVERSVEFEDNISVMSDFAKMIGDFSFEYI